jgi:hypothetical protein
MNTPATLTIEPPEVIAQQIAALEDELRALRRLLRISKAAAKARDTRERRLALQRQADGRAVRRG